MVMRRGDVRGGDRAVVLTSGASDGGGGGVVAARGKKRLDLMIWNIFKDMHVCIVCLYSFIGYKYILLSRVPYGGQYVIKCIGILCVVK